MSEEVKRIPGEDKANETPAGDGKAGKKPSQKPAPLTLKDISKGKLELATPIRVRDNDVTELHYDFSKLTGWEYAEAMDTDSAARNIFVTTRKQAISLFAAAAAKVTEDADAYDIKQQLGIIDAQRASVLATLFLNKAAQEAGKNTYGV